jgi:hypothetical protein
MSGNDIQGTSPRMLLSSDAIFHGWFLHFPAICCWEEKQTVRQLTPPGKGLTLTPTHILFAFQVGTETARTRACDIGDETQTLGFTY